MSVKEQLRLLASDSQKARVLSAQLLAAVRTGSNPTLVVGGRRITLVRTTAGKDLRPHA